MNRTPIEWVHPDPKRRFSWNPLTGCLTGCDYCYALTIAMRRFRAQAVPDRMFRVAEKGQVYPYGFAPTFYPHRLEEPARKKQPVGIFAVDMGDLFGRWVPAFVREEVLNVARACPRHTFYFLTKHPKGMAGLEFPDNARAGITITAQRDLWRVTDLYQVTALGTFISAEPLLGPVDLGSHLEMDRSFYRGDDTTGIIDHQALVGWLIVGALTCNGRTVPPEQSGTRREWVEDLVAQADLAGVPVFLKNNLAPLFPGERLRQEWPHA